MGVITLLKSIKNHHGDDIDFVIIDINLNDGQRKKLKEFYKSVVFEKPLFDNYKEFNLTQTPKQFVNCNYIYESFRLVNYDRLICLDSDMIITGSLDELLNCEKPFSAVPCWLRNQGIINDFNSGVMVLNKPTISQNIYTKLLQIARNPHSGGDQEILNRYFKKYNRLNKLYNVEKRGFHKYPGAKIIHFVGKKPWQTRRENETLPEVEHKFWQIYNKDQICVRNAQYAKIGLLQMLSWIEKYCNKNLSECSLLEIGSYAGDSTAIFATNLKEVQCIDPWQNGYDKNDASSYTIPMAEVEKEFDSKMACYDTITKKHKKKSTEFDSTELFDIIYIDGLHTYEGCKADILHLAKYLKPDGVLAGHDYCKKFEGVIKAVNETLGEPDQLFKDTSWVVKK
jgi:lipopolysaccharide biosynthesis glycosyltransferase